MNMSKNFDYYSIYYDLLYKQKDYENEIQYVIDLFNRYCSRSVKKILELGCGTGSHATYLSRNGYNVLGIDNSAGMVEIAKNKHLLDKSLQFEVADIRTLKQRESEKFDAIVSLFHVVSYLNTNDDFVAAFKTCKNHLAPGGVFIFDCWYGPAVLTDLPSVRFRKLEDKDVVVNRVSLPTVRFNENIVDVNFKIMVVDKNSSKTKEFNELHSMRYLFLPELQNLLNQANLKLTDAFEWKSVNPPGENSWNIVCIVTHKE